MKWPPHSFQQLKTFSCGTDSAFQETVQTKISQTVLVFFLMQQFFLPTTHAATKRTTLVIQPIADGASLEASEKTAALLREKLEKMPGIYIVDPKKVETILSYYESHGHAQPLPDLDQAQALVVQAKEHYFGFEYDVAEAELNRVVVFFEKEPDLLFDSGLLLRDAFITRGLVHAAKNGKSQAINDFQSALKIDSTYQLSEAHFPPSIHRLFAETASLQSKQMKGALRVQTSPKVVDVYLNGIYRGVSPLTLTGLDSGEHHLSLKANHYESIRQMILVASNEESMIERKLNWAFGKKGGEQKQSPSDSPTWRQIDHGVRIANLLKVDKVLFVSANGAKIETRFVDRKLRSGLKPIQISLHEGTEKLEENLDQVVRLLYAQTQLDLTKEAHAHLDVKGLGDPIVLGHHKKGLNKTALWGGVTLVGVGGLLLGLLSGGGGGGAGAGNVSVNFK